MCEHRMIAILVLLSSGLAALCYTTNTLDTIWSFIAETYVQLVATEFMCYSTGGSALTDGLPKTALSELSELTDTTDWLSYILYCMLPFMASCVDVSRTVLSGPFIIESDGPLA